MNNFSDSVEGTSSPRQLQMEFYDETSNSSSSSSSSNSSLAKRKHASSSLTLYQHEQQQNPSSSSSSSSSSVAAETGSPKQKHLRLLPLPLTPEQATFCTQTVAQSNRSLGSPVLARYPGYCGGCDNKILPNIHRVQQGANKVDGTTSWWHDTCFQNRNEDFIKSIGAIVVTTSSSSACTERRSIMNWVQHGDGNGIVSARAGSGKTQLLSDIYRHLCPDRYAKDRVIVLTFNTEARKELQGRGVRDAYTFHAFGRRAWSQHLNRVEDGVKITRAHEPVSALVKLFSKEESKKYMGGLRALAIRVVADIKKHGYGIPAMGELSFPPLTNESIEGVTHLLIELKLQPNPYLTLTSP